MSDQDLSYPTPLELDERTRNLLRDSGLRDNGFSSDQLAKEVVNRRGQLAESLTDELSKFRAATDRLRRNRSSAVQIAVLVVVAITAIILLSSLHGRITQLKKIEDGSILLANLLIGGAALAAGVVIGLTIWQRFQRVGDRKADLDRALAQQLPPLLRSIINDFESSRAYENDFDATDGPALVELATEATIPSSTFEQIFDFIDSHDSSAIGIAGNRGIGKSTIMDILDRTLGGTTARVQAPVLYDPPGLIRLIHVRLAEAASIRNAKPNILRWNIEILKQVAKGVGAILVAALLTVMLFVELDALSFDSKKGWHVGTVTLISVAVVGALIAYAGSRLLPRVRRRILVESRPTDARGMGLRQLEILRKVTEVQTTQGAKAAFGKFEINQQQQLKTTMSTLSHAENVANLRSFCERLAYLSNEPVLICIDELDKMAKPDDAIATVNGIKDLMHVPGVHFVVSVSTDAMHQFAVRGVPLRDVFDSTFDVVVEARRLTLDEARQILRRRTTNFSMPAVMFCHAWSGGVARDLIRSARACVDLRKRKDKAIPINELIETVVRADLIEVLNAAVARLRAANDLATSRGLYSAYHRFRAGTGPLDESIAKALEAIKQVEIGKPDTEAGAVVHALPQLLEFAARVTEKFAVIRSAEDWKDERLGDAVEQLASIRSALNVHPDAAAILLEEFNEADGLG
ncbi:hypothetical protein HH310_41860 [Actinoplanes sp. TBRC 11911]|uniref:P-loop NTPase fold protein n=1 Tax=Actinoplanes sp. TBRC 11911 TaxID=2729386 RepID=UPI00145F2A36|nr:P-loop NTPase fold protein [Actinoplanes sp. TBRC 11911]NMO57696.1 hypothetical protein [Actinoplanes sp. TBRC 11911]